MQRDQRDHKREIRTMERQRELSFPWTSRPLTAFWFQFYSCGNPLFPRWPQCTSAPWNQESLSTFPSAMVFADLSQSSVTCPVLKKWSDGASTSFKSTVGRGWSYFQIFCCSPSHYAHKSRASQANKLTSLQSPQFKWWGRQYPKHTTESRRLPGSLKICFTKIKIPELEKLIHDKVNM